MRLRLRVIPSCAALLGRDDKAPNEIQTVAHTFQRMQPAAKDTRWQTHGVSSHSSSASHHRIVIQAIQKAWTRRRRSAPANHHDLAHRGSARTACRKGGRGRLLVFGASHSSREAAAAAQSLIVVVGGRRQVRAWTAQGRQADRGQIAWVAREDIGSPNCRLIPEVTCDGVGSRPQGELGVPPHHPGVDIAWIIVALRSLLHVTSDFPVEAPARMSR